MIAGGVAVHFVESDAADLPVHIGAELYPELQSSASVVMSAWRVRRGEDGSRAAATRAPCVGRSAWGAHLGYTTREDQHARREYRASNVSTIFAGRTSRVSLHD